jgi:hypothetical protein
MECKNTPPSVRILRAIISTELEVGTKFNVRRGIFTLKGNIEDKSEILNSRVKSINQNKQRSE